VRIDERVVDRNFRVRRGNVTDAAHVGCKMIDLVDVFRHHQTFAILPQIRNHKVIGGRRLEFGFFDIDAAHAETALDEILDEVVPDEPAGAGNQHTRLLLHGKLLTWLRDLLVKISGRSAIDYCNEGVTQLSLRPIRRADGIRELRQDRRPSGGRSLHLSRARRWTSARRHGLRATIRKAPSILRLCIPKWAAARAKET